MTIRAMLSSPKITILDRLMHWTFGPPQFQGVLATINRTNNYAGGSRAGPTTKMITQEGRSEPLIALRLVWKIIRSAAGTELFASIYIMHKGEPLAEATCRAKRRAPTPTAVRPAPGAAGDISIIVTLTHTHTRIICSFAASASHFQTAIGCMRIVFWS